MVRLLQNSAIALLLACWQISQSAAVSVPLTQRDTGEIGDFSSIKKFAAIGDSYSSGVGAGTMLKGKASEKCRRFDGSYASRMNEDARMGGADAHDFTYLGCLGDKTPAIKEQAKKLGRDMDLITISGGGNDMGFANIIQGCIYQWAVYSNCDKAISKAENELASSNFENNINNILSEAKGKLSSTGSIYWTGYGTFFNADTKDCDKVKWNLVPEFHPNYLTQDFRKRVNKLVTDLNTKLKKLVSDADATFVDYEKYTQGWLGRFCDAGIDEKQVYDVKDVDRGRWNDMWFQTYWSSGDLKKRGLEYRRKRDPSTKETIENYRPIEGAWDDFVKRISIPAEYAKVFHPTAITHEFISNLIFTMMTEKQLKANNIDSRIETPSIDDTESCSANRITD